jgi:predicted GIY-YIG superfamily endonuclease
MVMGVYQIVNTQADRAYIGSSTNIRKRVAAHLSMLTKNRCPARHYKMAQTLIHGSNAYKECQRLKSLAWRASH